MVNFIVNRVKALFYLVLGLFKRALCCFRRRRRPSCEPIPLTNVGVVPSSDKQSDLQTWNSWEDCPTIVTEHNQKNKGTVQEQIEMYRLQRLQSEEEGEKEQMNFFEDMTPRITKQTKILLHDKSDANRWTSTNLSLAHDPVYNTSELGVWEDSPGWEDQTQEDWDTNSVLREKKRLDRERKMAEVQRKKMEREFRTETSSYKKKEHFVGPDSNYDI